MSNLDDIFSADFSEVRAQPPQIALNYTVFDGLDSYLASFKVGRINDKRVFGIAPVAASIEAISGSISALPLEVYSYENGESNLDDTHELNAILDNAVNSYLTTSEWLKFIVQQALKHGRSCSFLEKNGFGQVINIHPMVLKRVTIKSDGRNIIYEYEQPNGDVDTYSSDEVIDIIWKRSDNSIAHISPIREHKEVFEHWLKLEAFSQAIVQNPLPPLVLSKPAGTAKAAKNAGDAMMESIAKARSYNGMVVIENGQSLSALEVDVAKAQALEARKFLIPQIASIYGVQPSIIQDLTHGTMANTEQAADSFYKFTLKPWLTKIENEISFKIFGRNGSHYVRFKMDDLLRSSTKDRFDAYAKAFMASVMTPDEIRKLENLPAKGGKAGELFTQGANLTIESLNDNSAK